MVHNLTSMITLRCSVVSTKARNYHFSSTCTKTAINGLTFRLEAYTTEVISYHLLFLVHVNFQTTFQAHDVRNIKLKSKGGNKEPRSFLIVTSL